MSIRQPKISKEVLISAMQDYLPSKVVAFFVMQINHCNDANKVWTEEEKRFVLSMKLNIPELYDHMKSEGFALPCHSTIAQWLQSNNPQPGISGRSLSLLDTCLMGERKLSPLMM